MAAADLENALVRRADWRFLLPDPWPDRTVCFGGGALAAAAAAVSGEVVSPEHARDCDLAVVARADRATLVRARNALRPGGWCYVEWTLPPVGGAPAARRALADAGLEGTVIYWPWPPWGSAQYWVPLEEEGARRYFLASQPRPAGGPALAAALLRRGAWQLSRQAGVVAPLCGVARRAEPGIGAQRGGDLQGHEANAGRADGRAQAESEVGALSWLRARWSCWGLGVSPGRLSWLPTAFGNRATSKIVGFALAEPSPRPRVVVKRPRIAEAGAALAREAAVLAELHATRPGGVTGVPRVVGIEGAAERVRLAETFVGGRPVFRLLEPTTYRPLALAAASWLAELAGRPAHRSRAHWGPRLVEPALATFAQGFAPVGGRSLVSRIAGALEPIHSLPSAPEQRDFSPWNVLVDGRGRLAVLDWESAELDGLPLLDLVYFLTYLAFFHDGAVDSGRERAAYRRWLDPASTTGRVAREALSHYAARVGLPSQTIPPLRLLAWVLHSRSEHSRITADAGGAPTASALRRSVFLGLIEEELLWQGA